MVATYEFLESVQIVTATDIKHTPINIENILSPPTHPYPKLFGDSTTKTCGCKTMDPTREVMQ